MSRSSKDLLLVAVLRGLAVVSGLVVVCIVLFVLVEAFPALSDVGPSRFLSDASWHPDESPSTGTFNLLPIAAGTLLTSLLAVVVAGPLGILSAVFAQYYAPARLAGWYRRLVELMAGVPSVVYGLWGLVVLVPLVNRIHPPGQSLLAGVVILTLMILPTVALLTDAAFTGLPAGYARGAAALGLSRSTTAFFVMIPAARSGLATAVMLALVRAMGETMAVVMVCGNVARMPGGLFAPVRTLTATIALEMGYARGDHRSALFACGLVLVIVVTVFILCVELGSYRRPAHGD
ncbi:MAG: phosphate ABC transporter permease subunit PstC [Planctomycetes bacterium]|nr:phosphate ABC transporter permease subunit PstC [Planctomycetota bacterium]